MSESVVKPPALDLCESAPHRAVLGLLAVALGRPGYATLARDLQSSPPEQIAAIANHGHAQTILHSAFRQHPELGRNLPDDLLIYFAEMQRANGDRNRAAQDQLADIAALLAPLDIPVLALKGAADVLDPLHPVAAHRYISDLDVLIPQDRAADAARALRQAKGLPVRPADTRAGPHHHLAQIIHPDWLFTVELHIRPGSDAVGRVLDGAAMVARARPVGGVLIPAPEDRLLHHVLHGMELRHDTAELNLRLLADHLCYLEKLTDQSLNQALTRLETANLGDWLTDLSALAMALDGHPPAPGNWAATALARFGEPADARARDTVFWIRRYAQRLTRSGPYRRSVLRKMVSPVAWAEFIQFHRDRRNRFK